MRWCFSKCPLEVVPFIFNGRPRTPVRPYARTPVRPYAMGIQFALCFSLRLCGQDCNVLGTSPSTVGAIERR